MPSTIGHMLAGTVVAWTGDTVSRRPLPAALVVACALLGALPDVDLLIPQTHRTWSHSVTAAFMVFIVAAVVTGKVTRLRGQNHWRVGALCGVSYASHLALDWLGADRWWPYGLQLLWPFSDRWFVSGWEIFRQTNRREFFTEPVIRNNVLAVTQELAILIPIVLVAWLVREKALARLPAPITGRDHSDGSDIH